MDWKKSKLHQVGKNVMCYEPLQCNANIMFFGITLFACLSYLEMGRKEFHY